MRWSRKTQQLYSRQSEARSGFDAVVRRGSFFDGEVSADEVSRKYFRLSRVEPEQSYASTKVRKLLGHCPRFWTSRPVSVTLGLGQACEAHRLVIHIPTLSYLVDLSQSNWQAIVAAYPQLMHR